MSLHALYSRLIRIQGTRVLLAVVGKILFIFLVSYRSANFYILRSFKDILYQVIMKNRLGKRFDPVILYSKLLYRI